MDYSNITILLSQDKITDKMDAGKVIAKIAKSQGEFLNRNTSGLFNAICSNVHEDLTLCSQFHRVFTHTVRDNFQNLKNLNWLVKFYIL